MNILTAITIAASIEEKNAAKFLYYFGTVPVKGNPQDANVMYASVIYSRSLAEVMDTVGKGKVQAIIAREFGKHPLELGIGKKAEIIEAVEKETKEYFASKGITVEYVGFAEGLTLDPDIQDAINRAYIAGQNAKMAAAQEKSVPTLDRLADIEVKKSVATVASKWDGKIPALPSWVILPESLGGWFGSSKPSDAKK